MTVYAIDTSKAPEIYRTSNPEHLGRFCIDFQPENVPTIASFESVAAAKKYLIKHYGQKLVRQWFPTGITE